MHRSLIVLPDDTVQPFVDAIAAAKKSLRIKIFLFSDPTLLAAVLDAKSRGVKVRVMLNPARRSGELENESTRATLEAAGVEVLDSNPDFDITHEKSMVIDDETAFIQSLNWETKNLTVTRDYAVVTSHKHEVDEVSQCFDADWDRKPFTPREDSHLIWCTNNGRSRVAHFIDSAQETLLLQNERYQDEVIIEHLVRAISRGVKISVLARPAHTLKKGKLVEGIEGLRILKDLGAKVHKLKGLKLHAKMMLADDKHCLIGSINLAPGSFDSRRELAIDVHDETVIQRIKQVAQHDWEHSHPLDISDEGLLAEFKNNEAEVANMLALEHDKAHHKLHEHKGHNGN